MECLTNVLIYKTLEVLNSGEWMLGNFERCMDCDRTTYQRVPGTVICPICYSERQCLYPEMMAVRSGWEQNKAAAMLSNIQLFEHRIMRQNERLEHRSENRVLANAVKSVDYGAIAS